jgi:hypothetical protein
MQKLEIQVRDSHLTGRVEVGSATLPLTQIPRDGSKLTIWLPLTPPSGYSSARWNGKGPAGAASGAGASSGRGAGTSRVASDGEVLLEVTYKVGVGENGDLLNGNHFDDENSKKSRRLQRCICHCVCHCVLPCFQPYATQSV